MKLNQNQQKAVLNNKGVTLIVAGAGTGKTSTIVSKISNAIETGFAEPHQILATTFTNKAGHELKERLNNVLGSKANSIVIGTFHSISLEILQKHSSMLSGNVSILSHEDQVQIVRNILVKQKIKELTPSKMLDKIHKYKEGCTFQMTPTERNVFYAYSDELKYARLMDFSDLLILVIKMWKTDEEVRNTYRNTYKLICIDEYQDINNLQYEWVNLLYNPQNHLCCVGDPDQAIYGFRGANANYIVDFEKYFKDASIVKLECNYRSSKGILDSANALISCNKKRIAKTLYTESADTHKAVEIYYNASSKLEGISIAKSIIDLRSKDPTKSIAILVRNRMQIPDIEEAMIRYNIQYTIFGAIQFMDRAEIKDLLSYFKFLYNEKDFIAFKRMIQTPKRGIGDTTIEKIFAYAQENNCSYIQASKVIAESITKYAKGKLLDFISMIESAQTHTDLIALANLIYVKSGYSDTLTDDRKENVRQWIRSLSDFTSLPNYLEKILWQSNEEEVRSDVKIMTIHSSKGLEFDYVFLPGWEEGLLPYGFEKTDEEVEEERRLAYVGITRARMQAFISHANTRYFNGSLRSCKPSRFIRELGKLKEASFVSAPTIPNGTQVSHPRFGLGFVSEAGTNMAKVKFFDMERLIEVGMLRRT